MFHKFSREILWIGERGVEEVSYTIFCRKFLSHGAENFCRGTLYCVTIFRYRKRLCLRRLYQDFLSNFFVS